MKIHFFVLSVAILMGGSSIAQKVQDSPSEKFTFKTEWKGERITLPPGFAPDMKLKGIEEIRFAPGMLEPESDSFFSYVLVFAVSEDQELTEKIIKQEMLVYYRGLAGSILKRKEIDVDTGKFTFKLEKAESAKGTPESVKAKDVTQYAGKLDWVEPFKTDKPQVLHFELQSWADSGAGRNYLFVCASPKAAGGKDAIWKEMREIRRQFEVKTKDAADE